MHSQLKACKIGKTDINFKMKKLSLKGIRYNIIMLLIEARESIKRGIEILDVNEEIFNFSKSLSENLHDVQSINLEGKTMMPGDGISIASALHYFPSIQDLNLNNFDFTFESTQICCQI